MTALVDFMARGFATHALDALILGTVVALVTRVVLYVFRRGDAAARFGVLLAALAITTALPFMRAAAGHGLGAEVVQFPGTWAAALLLAWAALAGISLARVGCGLWRVRVLRKRCRELPDARLRAELAEVARSACPSRRVAVVVAEGMDLPAAIGFLRPAVVLPAWLLRELPAAELKQVVVHEVAHLSRWDDWTNLFQKVAGALFFFHPAVWWLDRRLSLEREMACDDAVLRHSGSARGYAECLLRIAQHSVLRRGVALAQTILGRMSQTSARVGRMLKFGQTAPAPLRRSTVAVLAVAVAAVLAALWQTPLLVSFRGSAPRAEAMASTVSAAGRAVNTASAADPALVPTAPKAIFHPRRGPSLARSARTKAKRSPELVQAKFRSAPDCGVLIVVLQDGNGAVVQFTVWQAPAGHRAPVGKRT